MRSSQEVYKEVAERCSAYDKKSKGECCCNNSTSDSKSCLNCTHFTSDEHCTLDLYDPIANKIR